jgi:hypothetical protein
MQKLIFSIRNYSTFEQNWDGYNGKPPTETTIKNSIDFLRQLPSNILVPFAGLSGDGEINLFWDINNIFIDIGFTGDSKYSYYARNSHGEEFSGDYIAISDNIPLDLMQLLKTINP